MENMNLNIALNDLSRIINIEYYFERFVPLYATLVQLSTNDMI